MRPREVITLLGGAAAWPFVARELGWIEGRTIMVEYRWTEVASNAPQRLRPNSSSAESTLSSVGNRPRAKK
jgi:hypothetical protein